MGKRKTAHIEKLGPDIRLIGRRVYGSSFKLNQDLGVYQVGKSVEKIYS